MAAASLDVNFKEELSAIEQCKVIDATHETSVLLSLELQGSRSFQKPSAQPLFTVFYNIPLKFKFGSLSPSFNRWQGQIP